MERPEMPPPTMATRRPIYLLIIAGLLGRRGSGILETSHMNESEQPVTRGDLERMMEALTTNLSEVREELTRRFTERFEAVLRRLDRIETNVNAIQMQTM